MLALVRLDELIEGSHSSIVLRLPAKGVVDPPAEAVGTTIGNGFASGLE
jgi:hypothetical protein